MENKTQEELNKLRKASEIENQLADDELRNAQEETNLTLPRFKLLLIIIALIVSFCKALIPVLPVIALFWTSIEMKYVIAFYLSFAIYISYINISGILKLYESK